jgi:hypothetical protein
MRLDDIITENNLLKDRVNQLESKLSEVERGLVNNKNISNEKFFSELTDRQSRAHNIILFNVPEFSSSVPADKCSDTSSFIENVFSTIGLSMRPVSVRRLGKITGKSRPLRLVLPTPADVFEIFKVKRKLLNDSKFSSVRVSSDLTVLQRDYLKSILSELKSRRENGENDIFIKYSNNVPFISKNGQTNLN